jgi:hypothetical protein
MSKGQKYATFEEAFAVASAGGGSGKRIEALCEIVASQGEVLAATQMMFRRYDAMIFSLLKTFVKHGFSSSTEFEALCSDFCELEPHAAVAHWLDPGVTAEAVNEIVARVREAKAGGEPIEEGECTREDKRCISPVACTSAQRCCHADSPT